MDHFKLYYKNGKELQIQVYTVGVFREDIGMQIGIDKWAVIRMQWGKLKESSGITLLDAQVIQNVKDGGYKYLGVLEADQINDEKWRTKFGRSISDEWNEYSTRSWMEVMLSVQSTHDGQYL